MKRIYTVQVIEMNQDPSFDMEGIITVSGKSYSVLLVLPNNVGGTVKIFESVVQLAKTAIESGLNLEVPFTITIETDNEV